MASVRPSEGTVMAASFTYSTGVIRAVRRDLRCINQSACQCIASLAIVPCKFQYFYLAFRETIFLVFCYILRARLQYTFLSPYSFRPFFFLFFFSYASFNLRCFYIASGLPSVITPLPFILLLLSQGFSNRCIQQDCVQLDKKGSYSHRLELYDQSQKFLVSLHLAVKMCTKWRHLLMQIYLKPISH